MKLFPEAGESRLAFEMRKAASAVEIYRQLPLSVFDRVEYARLRGVRDGLSLAAGLEAGLLEKGRQREPGVQHG